jgi:uncharacterized protein (TIGR02271 family)
MTHTVIGLFDNRSEAQAAMQDLIQEGFVRENIDISNRNVTDSTDISADTVSTGSGSGGGISGFFKSLFGVDETTANTYTNVANDADAILSVQVDSDERARRAAEILDRNGAIDVDERGAQYSEQNYNQSNYNQDNYNQSNYSQGSYNQQNLSETADTSATTGNYTNTEGGSTATNQNNTNTEDNIVIPVIEEQLQVGKREVEQAGARIRSRVVERPVEASVRLREEHVVVNRHPVNRAVTDADVSNFKEGDITLTERSEEAVVGKQARVVEEVEIGKQVTEREETVSDTVRRTDVEVEEINGDVTRSDDMNTRGANS